MAEFHARYRAVVRATRAEDELKRHAAGDRTSLPTLAALFLRLGLTSFGGPAAHVALMEDEVVRRRGWLSRQEFLDLVSASALIPGPNSTELAIHIGRVRAGWPGLIVAGLGFVLPAVVLTAAVAWAYVRFGSLPQAGWLLYGVKPVIIAVVVQAIVRLAPGAAKDSRLVVLGILALLASWWGADEIAVLLGAGLVHALVAGPARGAPFGPATTAPAWLLLGPPAAGAAATAATAAAVSLAGLFGVFLKIGALLFGSGYVLLAFLRTDLVERRAWLTEAQLVDAVAVGQLTPGPVFSTATFVGWLLQGPAGALVATVGIFLPAFVLVALSGPLVPRLRASRVAGAFLDGVNVASLALMLVVTARLLPASVVDWPTGLLAAASAALLLLRVNSTWLVLGGAAAGYALGATV